MADKDDIKKRILEEEDYIRSPKYGNSLQKYVKVNDEELEDKIIARLLSMTEEEVRKIYQEAVEALREEMLDSDGN